MFKHIMAVLAAAAVTAGMWSTGVKAEETSAPLKVMPLGDSITDGFNIVGGYRTTLWKQLEANGYTSEDVDLVGPNWGGEGDPNHAGYSGYSIADIPGQRSGIYNFIDWLMESYPADVVLLQIGTNDILSSYELDTMGDRLELLTDAVLSYLPEDGLLYVATIPYMDADVTTYTDAYTAEEMDAAVDHYNAAIRTLVEEKQAEGKQIALSDINAQLTKADLADGVHPNEGGYAKMGSYWYQKLEAYMKGTSEPDTEPTTEPTEPTVEPTEPTEPTVEPTEPTEPTVEPTEPTEPTVEPTEPTEPTVEPTEPTEPTVEPTEPTEPTVEPTEPTEPIVPTEAPTMEILKGDLNWDGQVNVLDVVLLSKYLLKADDGSNMHLAQADVYTDNVIDIFDLGMLKRIITQS